MIGKTILHYKILSKLGEGGMGVVYKAKDTKLDRDVAMKFLPANSIATKDEKSRFHQEAKAAARLSHANIAHVYEINEHEGETFIAMEYIDGETLSDKIDKGPLKLLEAIKIAVQSAEGLQAAHEKQITHRDIKSQNIMLTSKGVVKIMDFGLAKLSGRSMVTKAGSTLGTTTYMSPEQARGETADHRSDIWSLGVVLYEMVSGGHPFSGDYEQAVIYAILNEDAEPLTALRTGVPMELERIVSKCLTRDLELRYQGVADLIADLKGIELVRSSSTAIRPGAAGKSLGEASTVSSGVHTEAVGAQLADRAKPKSAFAKLLPWAIPALLFVAGWISSTMLRPPPIAMPLTSSLIFDADAAPVAGRYLALSPDGVQLAYVTYSRFDGARVWIRDLTDGDTRPLEGTEGAERPFWSPDGNMIGYFAKEELRVIPARGGSSNTLAPAPKPRGGAWSEQGVILYSPVGGPLFKIPASGGGTPIQITEHTPQSGPHSNPMFLPGGRQFLFWYWSDDEGTIHKGDLETGETEAIRPGGDPTYVGSGFLVFRLSWEDGSVFAQRFDPERGVSGQPLPLASGVASPGGTSTLTVSNRTVVFYPQQNQRGVMVWQSRRGGVMDSLAHRESTWQHKVSHDGTRVAFAGSGLWLHDLATNVSVRIPTKAFPLDFAWSPEDSRIAYSWSDGVRVVDLTDPAGEQVIYQPETGDVKVLDWSPDGQTILFLRPVDTNRTYSELWALDTNSDTATQVIDGAHSVFSAQFAPNGGWFAYTSDEGGGDRDVYLRPFPGPGAPIRISVGGGVQPRWRADGSELFYLNGEGRLVSVQVGFGERPSALERQVIPGDPLNADPFRNAQYVSLYDVHPDGQRFLLRSIHEENYVRLTVLRDWVEMLEGHNYP